MLLFGSFLAAHAVHLSAIAGVVLMEICCMYWKVVRPNSGGCCSQVLTVLRARRGEGAAVSASCRPPC